ncbi:MAG: hypothetical protein DCE90_05310 [Pseudanabaena sp.]|nr:MAG: hypothetical protein DCE90_05310 [Pseudanabaena sp.]
MNQQSISCQKITYSPEITLAMYRELASHIEQIHGMTVELFPQDSQEFSYLGSQIGGIWLTYPSKITNEDKTLVNKILNHYGSWKIVEFS